MDIQMTIKGNPKDLKYPIEAVFIQENGMKEGPFFYAIPEVVEHLTAQITNRNAIEFGKAVLLPNNTLFHKEKRFHHRIAVTTEKKKFFVRYREDIYQIEFPKLLLVYHLQETDKFYLRTSHFFALKEDEAINEETRLYSFPFPNVQKHNGRVCWGSNTLSIPSLSAIDELFQMFLSAPFNEDYGIATIIQDEKVQTFEDFLKYAEDKPFNDDWLLPTDKTIKDIL